ncbi:MAG: MarR family transcriptional regulator [Actinomycetota bacterium]
MGADQVFDDRITTYGRLIEAQRRLDQALAATYARFSLTASWFEALLRIRRSPSERLRMCQLADQMSISNGGATRLVDGLVGAGLAERAGDPTDRRVQLVTLTETGRRTLSDAVAAHLDDLDAQLFSRLDGVDVAELDRLLDQLRAPIAVEEAPTIES